MLKVTRNLDSNIEVQKIEKFRCGIRNAVINNFSSVDNRSPIENGALWENWIIAERLKFNNMMGERISPWFWRTKQQVEIDYLENKDGYLSAYEFKWNTNAKASIPTSFTNSYPDATFQVVTPANCENFICL